jgi:hypothetical protein
MTPVAERTTSTRTRWWPIVALIVLAAAAGLGWLLYERLWREHPQPGWILPAAGAEGFGDTQFKYLSLGAERNGLPYWVFYVLPTMFPEKLPGIGAYGAFGLAWEEGVELPVGMTKKVIGYPRVGINCALCHTSRYRKRPDDPPTFVPGGPGNTANVEALSRFFYESALDPRFNSTNILAEIAPFTKLDWIDRLLYRFVVIPATKERILKGGPHFLWAYGKDGARWGRGHDGPTYSSKYLADGGRRDAQYGSTQYPAAWNLAKYRASNSRGEAQRLNLTGDGRNIDAVISASIVALLGTAPRDQIRIANDAGTLKTYLERKPAPAYPYGGDDTLQPEQVAAGEAVFKRACAACHGRESALVGRIMPLAEIGTEPDAAVARSAGAADGAVGYVVPHLDGIWLRGPYLHNGSVPTIRDLLTPAKQRPTVFFRGYDVLDSENLGFLSARNDKLAERRGLRFDTTRKGNGNQGHEYGADLAEDQKKHLIAFLKTL